MDEKDAREEGDPAQVLVGDDEDEKCEEPHRPTLTNAIPYGQRPREAEHAEGLRHTEIQNLYLLRRGEGGALPMTFSLECRHTLLEG